MYVGISAFCIMVGYRVVESLRIKMKKGTYIDYDQSNFYTRN